MSKNPDAARRSPNKDITQGDKIKATLGDKREESKQFTAKNLSCLSSSEREIIKDAFSLTTSASNKDG